MFPLISINFMNEVNKFRNRRLHVSISFTEYISIIFPRIASFISYFFCFPLSVHYPLITVHPSQRGSLLSLFALCSPLFALRSSPFALRPSLSALRSLLLALRSLLSALCSSLSALCSPLSALPPLPPLKNLTLGAILLGALLRLTNRSLYSILKYSIPVLGLFKKWDALERARKVIPDNSSGRAKSQGNVEIDLIGWTAEI